MKSLAVALSCLLLLGSFARADEPAIPDSLEGLKAQFDAIVAARQANDAKKSAELLARIVIPEHETVLRRIFGDEAGAGIASDYAEARERIPEDIGKVVDKCIASGRTSVYVQKIENPTDLAATERDAAILGLMKKRVPLYLVGFSETEKKRGMGVSPFIHEAGAFRLLAVRKARLPEKKATEKTEPLHAEAAAVKAAIEGILTAAKAKDDAKVASLAQELLLSEPAAAFAKLFGPEAGARLAKEYDARPAGPELAKFFRDQAAKDRTTLDVDRFDKEDPRATGLQNKALAALKEKVALISVRMRAPNEGAGVHLWSFAVLDGKVRFLGKLRALSGGSD
jgi:hypothetical protein